MRFTIMGLSIMGLLIVNLKSCLPAGRRPIVNGSTLSGSGFVFAFAFYRNEMPTASTCDTRSNDSVGVAIL
jgi:hypothetical protein